MAISKFPYSVWASAPKVVDPVRRKTQTISPTPLLTTLGEIVVGGVDTHKYSGWLEPLAIYPPPQTQMDQWKAAQ
jgi:hypothetical protein